MRIVAAVVVVLVLLSAAHGVQAEEARRERSERCLEVCNFDFEKCTAAEGPKGAGRCNVDVVRCKNACPFVVVEEPAAPTYKSQQRCIDACQDVYKKCLADPKNKSGGTCAADDMRCERACPAPPEVATVPPGSPSADGAPGAAGAPVVNAPPAKPKRGGRSAAPAPAPATPAPQRVDAQPPTVRSDAVAPAATVAEPAAAARPAQTERGFFGTIGCFFVACEPVGSSPCIQQCTANYDECTARESKRGGECNTRLMHCRQACSP